MRDDPDPEQLPESSYTPIEIEFLDYTQAVAWLDSISERLESIKKELLAKRYRSSGNPNNEEQTTDNSSAPHGLT